ncbi:hypothetical protein FKW77_001961 [Venturia effusa]|uniref:Oxysterol binding protein n=1 Tax=Venturia effusa TaxID=50376 RepID=A0A517LKX6_9PEZI|nr:hypothetical protein FKW77_001961 [Venturia effusa]
MATSDRSALKEFLASIATIKGDLSNITAPPFLLATQSTTQFPSYWAEFADLFTAPAKEEDPLLRSVLVLKWFLGCLKRQQYAGQDVNAGVKKPLNAFLGEIFEAEWEGIDGVTKLVSEQVSHHPPVTACRLWNENAGVEADGFACQKITFSGSVNIKQQGHAILTLKKYDEQYLIPLPDVKVSGLLSGTAYPELSGTHEIVSTNGFVSEIDFSGKKMLGLGGSKNHVSASVFSAKDRKKVLWSVEGSWSERFTVRDEVAGHAQVFDCTVAQPSPMKMLPLGQQDPWESRKAWKGTIDALDAGNMQLAADEKSKVEEGQRAMRKQESKCGKVWEPLFFRKTERDERFERLHALTHGKGVLNTDLWVWDESSAGRVTRPFHGELRPDSSH